MVCGISMSRRTETAPYDFLYCDYGQFFESLGYQLITLPNSSECLIDYFDSLPITALILSGGNDLSPEFTGNRPVDVRNSAPERDCAEQVLLAVAIERRMPVLGICRGMHFINCYFKGNLTQTIDEKIHVRQSHRISFCDDRIDPNQMTVNSYHHQGVRRDQISRQLEPLAFCMEDDLVEALYHPDLPIVGIQWHPERLGLPKDDDTHLIKSFLEIDRYWRRIGEGDNSGGRRRETPAPVNKE